MNMQDKVAGTEGVSVIASASVFERFRDPIYRYILRLVHQPMEAEDLTQETFLRAYQHLSDLQTPEALRSWLYRIATHVCYDRFRQTAYRIESQSLDEEERQAAILEDHLLEESNEPTIEQVIDREEMSACIQSYIGRLADDYRITILLHDLHGMTCSEISQILSCSLEVTKIRLFRARQKLKIILAAGCEIGADPGGALTCDPKHRSH
jgi:RNA polymerase sigma-70 factor, ECF subfamily